MNVDGKVVVITGGASGIGAAMARAFVDEGARAVVVADVQRELGARVATDLGDRATFVRCDVANRSDLEDLLEQTEATHGPVDLLCANAGIASGMGVDGDDDVWNRVWSINVMGIVHAAAAYLPRVESRGEGYLLVTASAAGLLVNLGDAPYTATKHA
ncbi:MAG TPA: SDR family NAD(P)-dependent oxidoreductase, partial [Microthrixaceae bacterium]|nr:SDR family NAD(P)-dependent oxidoreductase [Microthrixaceae bacterium]